MNSLFYHFSAYKIVWAWDQNEITKEPKKTEGWVRVSPIKHLQKASPQRKHKWAGETTP